MSKPSQPAAPDYTGAANATSQGNLEIAKQQNAWAHGNQSTPWGNLTYTKDPSTGAYNGSITLDPAQQALLDKSNSVANTEGTAAQNYAQQASDAATKGIDTSGLPALNAGPQAGDFAGMKDQAYNDLMSRQNQNFNQQDQSLQNQLVNQGLTPGTEAWNRAYQPLNQSRVDASNQSDLAANALENQYFQQGQSAAGMGNQVRGQGIQEQAYQNSNPLNMLNALKSGSQVTTPQFGLGGPGGGASVQGPNMNQAAQQQGAWQQAMYGADTSTYNSQVSTAGQLAMAAALYF